MSRLRFGKFILFATAASAAFSLEPNASLITYSCYISGRLVVNSLSKKGLIGNNTRDLIQYALGGFIFGKFYTAFSWIYRADIVNSILFPDSQLELLPSGINYVYHLSLVSIFKSTFLLTLPLFCVGFLNEELDGLGNNKGFDYIKTCRNLFFSSSIRYFIGHGIEHNFFSAGAYFIGGIAGTLVFELLDGISNKSPLFSDKSKLWNFQGLVFYKSVRDLCSSTLSTAASSAPILKDLYCSYDILFSVLNKLSDQISADYFCNKSN